MQTADSKASTSFDEMKTSLDILSQKYDYFLFDCDGVLWEAEREIPQSFQGLKYLQSLGKKIFFITNSSHRSQQQYSSKFQSFSFSIHPTQAYPSSYVTAKYLSFFHPEIKTVYMIGMGGLKEELENSHLEVLNHGTEESDTFEREKSLIDKHKKYDAVVCGLDFFFTYKKLLYATTAIQKGSLFISTNLDSYDKIGNKILPENGMIIESIRTVVEKTPISLGKPNPLILDIILKENQIPISEKSKFIMIGDRIDTDIQFAKNSGIDSCLVFTGCTKEEDFLREAQKENPVIPTYLMPRVGTFLSDFDS